MRRWLAVLVAASILGACGGEDDEVTVAVERSRLFEQQRSLGVTIHNDGDEPAVIDAVRFGAGRYEEVPATDRTVTVPAGGAVSFPVPFGVARCDSADDEVLVHLRVEGDATTRRVPVSGQVERAHQRECAAEVAQRAVRIDFAEDWEVVAPRRVRGSLEVTPLDGHEVEVTDVVTSIVFVTEEVDRSAAGPSLEVVAGRCDTHALIESKKTFTFVVSVAIDGEEPVSLEVVPEAGPARAALQAAIEDCLDEEPVG